MPADWTLPSNYVVSKDHGKELDVASEHFDREVGRYTAIIKLRDSVTGEWYPPKVTVVVNSNGTTITSFVGTKVELPNITFAHASIQGLSNSVKLVTFVSSKMPDPTI